MLLSFVEDVGMNFNIMILLDLLGKPEIKPPTTEKESIKLQFLTETGFINIQPEQQ